MLILTRLVGQSIEIGDNITITLVRTRPGGARIGIDAPREIPIVRDDANDREQPHLVTCPGCLHTDTLYNFDVIGDCWQNVFCRLCHTEFHPATGEIHPRGECCERAIEREFDRLCGENKTETETEATKKESRQ